MAEIQVGKTIAFAYTFTLGNFVKVLELAWLPLAISGVAVYFFVPFYFSAIASTIATGNPGPLFAALGLLFLLIALSLACFSMVYVALVRHVLSLRDGATYFYFSVDPAFWRLFKAYLLLTLMYFGLLVAGVLAFIAVVAGARAILGEGGSAIASILGGIAFFVAILYGMVRSTFLIPPVAVMETQGVIRRSWLLAGGNMWRIAAVLLAIIVPFTIVELALQLVVSGFVAIAQPPEGAPPAEMAAYFRQVSAQMSTVMLWLVPIGLFLYAILFSVMAGASAFAYRSLVPSENSPARLQMM